MRYFFRCSIKFRVSGHNIDRFINRLVHSNISILSMNKFDDYVLVVILKRDLDSFYKLVGSYDYVVVSRYGLFKLRDLFFKNLVLIIIFIFGFLFLFFLSNIIFDIDVVYDNSDVSNFVLSELRKYGIDKYHFVKSFDEVEHIKKQILSDYKDRLEWLEIERAGVKYIVRLEERKISNNLSSIDKRNVVSKKSSIIKNIYASNGSVVKKINDYVKAGDIVISGSIYLNDELRDIVSADGFVFGEVWYKSKVFVPYTHNEINYKSKVKSSLVFNFLSHSFSLFGFSKSNSVVVNSSKLLYNFLVPFNLSIEKRRQADICNKIYTVDEALDEAESRSILSIKDRLNDSEYIISSKRLSYQVSDEGVFLEMFFSVYENITDYGIIEVQE